MPRLILLATAFILAITTGPGFAQTVTVEDATVIKTMISEGLKTFPPACIFKCPTEYRWAGEPQVISAVDHYDVTLPALTIEAGLKTRFDVGEIHLKVTPRPDANYAVEVILPSAISVRQGDAPAGAITIGNQRFTGVWSPAAQIFLTIDSAYKDVVVVDAMAEDNSRLRVGSLSVMQEFRLDKADTASGTETIRFSDLMLTDRQENPRLMIGGMAMELGYDHLDISKTEDDQDAVADTKSLWDGILNGVSINARISGLSGSLEKERVGFDQLSFAISALNLDKETSTISLDVKADGLKLPLYVPIIEIFKPKQLNARVLLDKLPNTATASYLFSLAGIKQEDTPASLQKKLFEAISKAGAELRVERVTFDNSLLSASITGAARMAEPAEGQTAFKPVGGAEISLRGLDLVIQRGRDGIATLKKQKADAALNLKMQEMVAKLLALQLLGQQSKDADGAELRTYKIEATPTGAILLNGGDIKTLKKL